MVSKLKNKEIGRGNHKLDLQLMNPPSSFLLVEHFEHDAYQKNTFLMQNLDSQEKDYVLL